jgi:uncharacterized metal-binding protein YceD (DUF177 family)
MFKFKIFEIPEGKSNRTLSLDGESLDLGEITLLSGTVHIEFDRTPHVIRAVLDIEAVLKLTCDRSLEEFDFPVDQRYEILFKFEEIEESTDEHGAIRNIDHASKQIDIEQDVHDTLLVSLPAKKLHPKFLDEHGEPKEFLNEQFGEFEDEGDTIDPRWAALKDLKK